MPNPVIAGSSLWDRVDFVVTGYFRYYDRPVAVPGSGVTNQVSEWKKYLAMRRETKNEYGEAMSQAKSDLSAHAEMRTLYAFPAFYDPLTDSYEPLLLLLRMEFDAFGYPAFPQTKTAEQDRLNAEFHRRYKDLFGVAQQL